MGGFSFFQQQNKRYWSKKLNLLLGKYKSKYILINIFKRYIYNLSNFEEKSIGMLNKRSGAFFFDIFRHKLPCRSPPSIRK